MVSKLFIFVFLCTTVTVLHAAYMENFDTASDWYGGYMTEFNTKHYTNAIAAPSYDGFIANYAERETSNTRSDPYAWRIATTADSYFRYHTKTVVTNFSLWLARETGAGNPDIKIRYSRNSGATWTDLYHGDTLFFGTTDYAYICYSSPELIIQPNIDQEIYIEVYKFSGPHILIDDFTLNGRTLPEHTVFMVSPAPAVTSRVGSVFSLYTVSSFPGNAHVGYGKTPYENSTSAWTWIDAQATNIFAGYGAVTNIWLMPEKWYYACRWIRQSDGVTNYGWNTAGQTDKTNLAAEYMAYITSTPYSVVWNFGYPFVTTPTQGPTSSTITFNGGVSSNWPGDATLATWEYTTGSTADTSRNTRFSTTTLPLIHVGFFMSVKRNQNGPQFVDVEYSINNAAWQPFLSNIALPHPESWYMIGQSLPAADKSLHVDFRVSGYNSATAQGQLSFDNVQIYGQIPEPLYYSFLCFLFLFILPHRIKVIP